MHVRSFQERFVHHLNKRIELCAAYQLTDVDVASVQNVEFPAGFRSALQCDVARNTLEWAQHLHIVANSRSVASNRSIRQCRIEIHVTFGVNKCIVCGHQQSVEQTEE